LTMGAGPQRPICGRSKAARKADGRVLGECHAQKGQPFKENNAEGTWPKEKSKKKWVIEGMLKSSDQKETLWGGPRGQLPISGTTTNHDREGAEAIRLTESKRWAWMMRSGALVP